MSYCIEYSGTFPLADPQDANTVLTLAKEHDVADLVSLDTLLTHGEIEIVDGAIDGHDANERFLKFLKATAPMLRDSCIMFTVPGWVLGDAGALMARNGTLYYADAALTPVTPWRPAE